VAGRKEIIADVAQGPVGVVDDPTVSPKLRPVISQRVTPAQFLHRLFSVATHDGIYVGTGGKPVLGILRHVPAAQKDEGSCRTERISSRMNSTSRFQFTEKQTKSVPGRQKSLVRPGLFRRSTISSDRQLGSRTDAISSSPKGGRNPAWNPSLR
jgi:hypothetical protein